MFSCAIFLRFVPYLKQHSNGISIMLKIMVWGKHGRRNEREIYVT
jgi:hypothetical protein